MAPDVRDQQIEKPRAADLRDACCVVTRKYDDSAIVSHATMNAVRIVGQQHEPHAGEEQVVLQAQQPRQRCPRPAKIPGGEDGDAGGGAAEQQEKER